MDTDGGGTNVCVAVGADAGAGERQTQVWMERPSYI